MEAIYRMYVYSFFSFSFYTTLSLPLVVVVVGLVPSLHVACRRDSFVDLLVRLFNKL